MAALWTCSWCGGLNLPADDCLWCYGLRKQAAASAAVLASIFAGGVAQ